VCVRAAEKPTSRRKAGESAGFKKGGKSGGERAGAGQVEETTSDVVMKQGVDQRDA